MASCYRDLIQDAVGEVLDSVRLTYQKQSIGRITSMKIKEQVRKNKL